MRYEISYATLSGTDIYREVEAPDPFTACMELGRITKTKVFQVTRVVERRLPAVLFERPWTPPPADAAVAEDDYVPAPVEDGCGHTDWIGEEVARRAGTQERLHFPPGNPA